MKTLVLSTLLAALLAAPASAQREQTPGRAAFTPLPRDLEIQLALSALPPHLRDSATVYVLNPAKGFEVARSGTNGFHAFVARTGDDTFRGSWPLTRYRDDILYPIAFDAAGPKAQMRVFFDAAAMQAQGMPPEALKKLMQQRYASGYYKAPDRPGVSYMLAPVVRTYVNPDQGEDVATAGIPHVMHYAPNVSGKEIGGAIPTAEQFHYYVEHGRWPGTPDPMLILQGPHGYLVQFEGVTERDEIVRSYAGMLERLCGLNALWCLPK